MVATKIIKILACLLAVFSPLVSARGQNVLTQHNDNGRTGQDLNETILTLANVNPTTFGKLFSMPVDGYIYAQPLYMSNVSIAGGTHNVVYVATEGDSVYAFDADTGAQLWHVSVIDTAHGATSGETTLNFQNAHDTNCTDLVPQVGITSTPVIDPISRTIYVEGVSRETNGTYIHRLHMLDIATGAEKSPGPKIITATVPGTSGGGTTITFNALLQLNRPGLLLSNGTVYIGYASHCDDTPYHGWLIAYNAATLNQAAVFISTPNGVGYGGIWMSGAGIAADSSGNIFTATGNGNYDATDEGDSILKLNGSTLTLSDYFTPFNQADLQSKDYDLGSGGVLLLPDQPGANPHELIQAGKGGQELDQTTSLGGIIYVVNRDQMTTNNSHYCSSSCNNTDPEIVQEIQKVGSIAWMFAMPAYWNNTVYIWGSNDVLRAYSLTNGLLSTTPSSSSTVSFGHPGATPSISANGSSDGIVWAIETDAYQSSGPAILRAFQATNVANQLYASNQSGSRDTAGDAVKFAVPTIANGKVYVGTQNEVTVYGLLGSYSQQAATPTITPGSGTQSSPVTVMLTDATPGATITYTTDGTVPVPGSNGTAISSGGSFSLSFTSTATVKAIASASGLANSAMATANYSTQSSGGPSYGSGFTSAGLTLNKGAAISGTRLRVTDGGTGEARSAFFSTPVNVTSFTNAFTFQDTSAKADGLCFVIEASGPTAVGGNGGGLGYAGTTGALSTGSLCVAFDLFNSKTNQEISNTGLFTNGASPTGGAGSAAGGLSFQSGHVMSVQMNYDGTTLTMQIRDTVTNATYSTSFTVDIPSLVGGSTAYVGFTGGTGALTAIQDVLTWIYTPGSSPQQAAPPTITPGSGTQSSPVTVMLTDATPGATITYTTDGTAPVPGSNGTAISSGGSFSLSFTSTATVKAIASASGFTDSAMATANYSTQSSGGPNYGSGFTSAGLTLNKGAAISGTRLRVTDGGTGEARSAFFSTPVNVTSFTNAFTFQDTSAKADGLCFVIEASGPTAVGGNGGGLGYAGTTGALSTGSLCVAFDLFNSKTNQEISNTGLFTNGASPTGGAGSAAGGLSFQSGHVMSVQMNYDGTTLTMQIRDTVTNATYSTSFTVDIPSLVGGSTAYVGFTGGTGALTAIQDVLTWIYTPGSSPQQAAPPTITPGSGTQSSPVTVMLTDATPGATITYTTDGTAPVPGSNGTAISSGGSFSLSFTSTATVKAIASASGFTDSAMATANYSTQSSGGPSYGSGFTSAGLTLNKGAAISGTRLRVTDGGTGEARSAFFSTPVNVTSFTNAFTFQDTSAKADGLCFVIEASGPTAVGGNGGGLGYAGTTGALSTGSLCVAFDLFNSKTNQEISNTGLFTNGASPTGGAGSAAGGLSFQSGHVMSVQMNYDGTTLTMQIRDTVTNATYSTSFTVDIPSLVGGSTAYVGFTGGTGALTAIQDVLTWIYTP